MHSITDVQVANGTSLSDAEAALPSTVAITLSDGTTPSVDVTWDEGTTSYDPSTVGSYPFVGTLTLPNDVTNPSGITAAVNVDIQS